MYIQNLTSILDYASGPLLPLVTAIVAAWVALKIAAHNARRSTERDAISELRIAYAKWCDVIGEMATNKIEEHEYESLGYQRDQTRKTITDDVQRHVQSIAKLQQAASRVRILDAALPKEFDIIISVLVNQKWDFELSERKEYADPVIAANQCAHELIGRVAVRLLSKKPFHKY